MDATEFEAWLSRIATLSVPQRRRVSETLALSDASGGGIAADTARDGGGSANVNDAAVSGDLLGAPLVEVARGCVGADLPRDRCKACRRTFNAPTKTPFGAFAHEGKMGHPSPGPDRRHHHREGGEALRRGH
jgi:hypothetical protein